MTQIVSAPFYTETPTQSIRVALVVARRDRTGMYHWRPGHRKYAAIPAWVENAIKFENIAAQAKQTA